MFTRIPVGARVIIGLIRGSPFGTRNVATSRVTRLRGSAIYETREFCDGATTCGRLLLYGAAGAGKSSVMLLLTKSKCDRPRENVHT